MFQDEELICAILRYGRTAVQDFVARSRYPNDAVTYLQMERYLEMIKGISFTTTNLVSFDKRKAFVSDSIQEGNPGQCCMNNVPGPAAGSLLLELYGKGE